MSASSFRCTYYSQLICHPPKRTKGFSVRVSSLPCGLAVYWRPRPLGTRQYIITNQTQIYFLLKEVWNCITIEIMYRHIIRKISSTPLKNFLIDMLIFVKRHTFKRQYAAWLHAIDIWVYKQNLATWVYLMDEARGLDKVHETAHINVKLLH